MCFASNRTFFPHVFSFYPKPMFYNCFLGNQPNLVCLRINIFKRNVMCFDKTPLLLIRFQDGCTIVLTRWATSPSVRRSPSTACRRVSRLTRSRANLCTCWGAATRPWAKFTTLSSPTGTRWRSRRGTQTHGAP